MATTDKLTEAQVKNTKPTDAPYKVSDGGGMFLLVKPTGRKYWHLAYRYNNKQKLLALGVYPDVSLAKARKARDKARKLIKDGLDPSEEKKAAKKEKDKDKKEKIKDPAEAAAAAEAKLKREKEAQSYKGAGCKEGV